MSENLIPQYILDEVNSSVKSGLKTLNTEQQNNFVTEYNKKKKDPTLIIILAILFPIQLFLLGKTGLGVAYWLTGGGCGVWWIVEIILANKRTKEYNEDVASQILRDIKIFDK